MKYIITAKATVVMTKRTKSIPKPAWIVIGVRVKSSIEPKEWTRNGQISAIAKDAPWTTAYTKYNGIAANMKRNSIGSVTPVKKTAKQIEINMVRYSANLSLSTLRYIA